MSSDNKIKSVDRDRGTSPAELRSSGPKQRPDEGSDESRILEGASFNAQESPFDIERRNYLKFLRRFFKGDDSGSD